MVIDITKFLIITQENFITILTTLGVDILPTDKIYYASYILTNIFAYLLIYLFIDVIIKLYFEVFKGRRGWK